MADLKLPPGATLVQSEQSSLKLPPGATLVRSTAPVPSTPTENQKPGLVQRIDSAVTDALAPNARNYQSLARTNAVEVPKTAAREAYSMGKTVLGVIPSTYHAFADAPTEEEKKKYAQFEKEEGEAPGTETSGLKRVGLGLGRIIVDPVANAVDFYKDVATGKQHLDAGDVLSVAPEAIGTGAGNVVAGKAAEVGLPKIPGVARSVTERPPRFSAWDKAAANQLLERSVKQKPPASPLGSAVPKAEVVPTPATPAATPAPPPEATLRPYGESAGQPKPLHELTEDSVKPPVGTEEHVSNLSNENLRKLIKARGLEPDDYNFQRREALREGGSKHPVERIAAVKDVMRTFSPEELQKIEQASAHMTESPDLAPKTRATRAKSVLGHLFGEPEAVSKPSGATSGEVSTTVDPDALMRRWGVDEQSLKSTDSKLRSLSREDSDAYLDKLAESYKRGAPVEPIVEVRDAENNLVEADGRHRLIAAKRAGLERVPVVVRRAAPVRPLSGLNLRVAKSLGLSPRAVGWLQRSGLTETGISKLLATVTPKVIEQLSQ